MPKSVIALTLVLGSLACATPQRTAAPATADPDPAKKEIAQLKETLVRLDNRLGHLESEVSASSAENELTTLTIDSVRISDRDGSVSQVFGPEPKVLCHVAEWRGYGKMLRFTRKADPTFDLEAEGHSAVQATMATGGICNSDGSTRFVVLQLSGAMDPGAHYQVQPRNENDHYRWSVPADLVVSLSDTK